MINTKAMVKIGVLIPTRGDRPEFLRFALKQISQQTRQPDEIFVMNDKPLSDRPDITYRYRVGCSELFQRGCDLVYFWEDDDFYKPTYIEAMYDTWEYLQRPDLLGLNHTTYYNLNTQKYLYMQHQHASMFSTVISREGIKKVDWGDDNYSFTDMIIWKQKQLRKITQSFPDIAIGIKHGTGLCGGGGHVNNWAHYDKAGSQDTDFDYLKQRVTPEAMNFYRAMSLKSKLSVLRYEMKANPFLTIVTRSMPGKRPTLFKQHQDSIKSLKDFDFQQIFIEDRIGVGMLNANCSFQLATQYINGKYVYLLDDDDFFKNPNFISLLKAEAAKDADMIFFKMKILTGDGDEIYPKPGSWGNREVKRGQIGGSCFVVKKWVYEKYIHHFTQPSFGDWHFITACMADKNVKASWLDVLMSETGKVSRGKAETV